MGLLWLILGGLALGSWGCVAGAATVHTRRAQKALEQAEAGAGAPNTYHLTLARAYLEKAREEASEAQYQAAIRLARACQQHAREALASARPPGAGSAE